MAKFGEGDPRWLVEDRADGTNVNNWHWTETNCTAWAKERFNEIFNGLLLEENQNLTVKIKNVDSFSGEVTVSTRKGKIFVFLELDVKLRWEGFVGSGKTQEGKMEFSLDTDDPDFEVQVTTESHDADSSRLKDVLRIKGRQVISEKISRFNEELREVYAPKILKQVPNKTPTQSKPVKQTDSSSSASSSSTSSKSTEKSAKISTKKISMKIPARAPVDEVYRAILDSGRVSAFTQSSCVIGANVGEKFTLFNGSVVGEQVELVPSKKIVQKWRFTNWPEDHYSTVTMEFTPTDDGMEINFIQTNVPYDDVERTERGWKDNFFRRMKMLFGWGNMFGE